jgi:hypothetical protein
MGQQDVKAADFKQCFTTRVDFHWMTRKIVSVFAVSVSRIFPSEADATVGLNQRNSVPFIYRETAPSIEI